MSVTAEQVAALAPDAASAKNGRQIAGAAAKWASRGRHGTAVWGEFKGSGKTPYQIRADTGDAAAGVAWKCSCPSRKQPCKHALGLLFVAAEDAASLTDSDPPDWVAEWLAKRDSTAKAKATKAAAANAPADPAAQAKRRGKREAKIAEGLDRLDLWLEDLVRNGLAAAEEDADEFERQAARLVDAQAPGLAARLRSLADLPRGGRHDEDRSDRLLTGLGQLRLLTHAYRRGDALPEAMRERVRGLVGWNLTEADLLATGERVGDVWLTLGTIDTDDDAGGFTSTVRLRRTHLWGVRTGTFAEVVQFAALDRPFAQTFADRTLQPMELAFHPAPLPRRAAVVTRTDEAVPAPQPPPGTDVAGLLDAVAASLAADPWLDRHPAVLADVVPLRHGGDWWLRDVAGKGVRLTPADHRPLLARSGGRPLTAAGEWAAGRLRVLTVWAAGNDE